MLPINLPDAFKANIILLKSMGLWSYDKEIFYKFVKYYVQGSVVFDSTFLTLYILVNYKYENVTGTIYSLPGSIQVVLKSIFIHKNFRMIKQTLNNLKQPEFQPKNQTQVKILQDSIILSRKIFYSFFCLVFSMITMWMISPITKSGHVLPNKYWIPFNYRIPIVYETLYFFECCCIIFHGFSNVAVDTFFSIAMVQIGAQCDILCDSIKNIHNLANVREDSDSQEDYNRMDKVILECIHHYNLIVQYASFLSKSFKQILIAQFMCSTWMLCGSMYELSLSDPTSAHFIQVLLFQMSATSEIFLYCWFANEVMFKSERLYYATFESRWYNSSKTFKKNLIIFTYQVRKPICLYVWNIIPVDIKTFTGLLQKCWSFFVAMKNTEDIRAD